MILKAGAASDTQPNTPPPEGATRGRPAAAPASAFALLGPHRVDAIALFLLALVLGGCAGDAPERGAVTLVFKYARILGSADPLPGLLREFETAHPGVRVKGESLPWTSDEQHQFYVITLE